MRLSDYQRRRQADPALAKAFDAWRATFPAECGTIELGMLGHAFLDGWDAHAAATLRAACPPFATALVTAPKGETP